MAKKQNIQSDRDSLYGPLLDQENQKPIDWSQYERKDSAYYGQGNPPAESPMATGRNCPQCAAPLMIFELEEEKEVLIVQCTRCKRKWHHPDLDQDAIYRQIPQDLINRYIQDMERQGK